ncbi:putative sulfoacetate--CoA ligase [compost metagenome]
MPATFRALATLEDLAELDLSEVAHVLSGGTPLTPDDAAAVRKVFPQARIIELYGQTEAGPISLSAEDDPGFATGRFAHPFPGVCLRIAGEQGPAEPGEIGLVEVKSPYLMRGYWPGTGETFAQAQGDWHPTGDLGFFDPEGVLHLQGRQEAIIVAGSEKVNPREVEAVLLRHPAIREAAVLGVSDPAQGQRIVAWVVPVTGDFATEAAMRHCEQYMSRHKCPHEVHLVESLPRTESGKVHQARLMTWAQV